MTERRSGSNGIELAAALDAARAAVGTTERVASLRTRLAGAIASGVGAGPLITGRGPVANDSTTTAPGARELASARPQLQMVAYKAAAFVVGAAAIGAAVWIATRQPSAAPEPGERAPAPAMVRPATRSSRAVTAPAIAPARLEAPSPPTAAPIATPRIPAASSSKARKRERAPSPSSVPAIAPLEPTTSSGNSEVSLISRAQSLVDSQPAAALSALRDHEHLYPRGLLREEREVLRIDAEWHLGQTAAALSHARAFVQHYPHSTQTRRMRQLLADHKNETDGTPTQ